VCAARRKSAPTASAPAPSASGARLGLRAFLPWWLGLTFALKACVLAQLYALPLLQPVGTTDGAYYLDLARRVAAGDLALGPAPFHVAPLYVYVLGLLLALGGGHLLVPAVAQIGLGAAAVGLVHATARRLAGARAAVFAAVAMTLCGLFTFDEVRVQHGALDPFLTALALWAWARALHLGATREQASAGPALLAGLTFGLLALNRPNALLVALGLPALLLLLRGPRRAWRQATLVLAGLVLTIGPFMLRNVVQAGEPVLIAAHGGLNLYIGNNPDADGTYHHVPGIEPSIAGQVVDARRLAETALGRPLTSRAVSNWFAARAVAWWRAQPRAALLLLLRKLAYLGNQAELPLDAAYSFYARDLPGLLGLLPLGAGVLVPLGLAGLAGHLWQRRGDAEAWRAYAAWLGFVPLYALSVVVFFVTSRYRLPWLVPLCIGTGLACDRLLTLVTRPRARRELALSLLLIATLAWAARHDFGLDDGRAEERTRYVEMLVDAGQLDAAQAALVRFERGHPRPAELWARAGRACAERGQPAEAAVWLARASALAPHDVGLHLAVVRAWLQTGADSQARNRVKDLANLDVRSPTEAANAAALGELALEWHHAEAAERLLRAALAVSPAPVARWHERLGLALALQERPEEALVELERAGALDPASASAQLNRAVVLAQLGRATQARAAARAALRLQPDYPQARGLLATLDGAAAAP
jgi:tetratricopeptide (TPR) repeat protein